MSEENVDPFEQVINNFQEISNSNYPIWLNGLQWGIVLETLGFYWKCAKLEPDREVLIERLIEIMIEIDAQVGQRRMTKEEMVTFLTSLY